MKNKSSSTTPPDFRFPLRARQNRVNAITNQRSAQRGCCRSYLRQGLIDWLEQAAKAVGCEQVPERSAQAGTCRLPQTRKANEQMCGKGLTLSTLSQVALDPTKATR